MAAIITWTVEADFDADAVYEEVLTGRVSKVTPGINVSRGVDRSGRYQISQLTLGLDNEDGRYSPENSAGTLYSKLEPGVKLRVKSTHSAVTRNAWTGYVQRWESVGVQAGTVAEAKLLARDILEYLRTYDSLNVLTSTTRRTDQALSAIFVALNIDAALYSLDTGIQTLSLHFARSQNALAACLDAVISEMGGYFWVRADGVMRLESRASRVGGYAAPDATWGDGTSIIPFRASYEYANSELVSTVTVRPTIFLNNQDTAEVFRFNRSKDNRPADSLALAAGEIYEAEFHYDAPVLVLSAPVAQQDYLANTSISGAGTDKTSALTVTATDLGGGVRLRLVNTDAGTIYVTEFRLRGTTDSYAADKPHFVAAKSIPGQVTDRSVDIDLHFSDDTGQVARDYSVALLRTQRYPVYRVHLEFHPEKNDTAAANLLAREIDDLVRYTDSALGAKGLYLDEWLYIDGITLSVFPGQAAVIAFTLTPAYAYRNLDKIVYDLFTRGNAATLGTALKGGTWAESTNFGIVSNKARPSNVALVSPNLQLNSADCVVEVSLSNMSADTDEEVGLVYRYADGSNYWRAYLDDGSNEIILEKVVAGVVTELASPAWTPTDTAELQVIVQGNRHRVRVDRKWVIDVTDAALAANTKVGLFSRNTTVVDFDDLYSEGL